MNALVQAVICHSERHADGDGLSLTPVEGLRMMCVRRPSEPMHSIYKPLVCLVLQGAKQMTIGPDTRLFHAGQSVVVALDAPVTGRVVEACPDAPYVAIAIELDTGLVRELATELGLSVTPGSGPTRTLFVLDTEQAALDCAMRLLRLLDTPDAITALRPAIMKELHYWLLKGEHGPAIRRLAFPDGQAERVAAAARLLRAEFHHPVAVERLAAAAGMSVSTFRRRFEALTSLTPIQFQKKLKLVEARRLMLSEGRNAGQAAFAVGYESVSHFTRDYGRLFGTPPRRDVRALTERAPAEAGAPAAAA